jgi:thiamine-phosphate diphosphorylase
MIDYVAIGPVFDTLTKDTGYSAVGIERVRHAAEHNRWPVVAIGGITLETAPEVIAAGASSVAVISDSSRQAIRQVASGNICSASAG